MRWILAASMFLCASPAIAQDADLPQEVVQADNEAAAAALTRMSAKLRSFDRFTVKVHASTEEVFKDGEKLQFLNETIYDVAKPDRLYASVRSDRIWRRYFYDGNSVTVSVPQAGYYASMPASGPILTLLDRLEDSYGISVPLKDLFRWGTGDPDPVTPTEAFLVGFAQVGESATDQYFYRAPGVDFQIWIGRDDDLPHRLVITNTDDVAQPQYIAALEWDTAPSFPANRFTFQPDANSRKVPLRPDASLVADEDQGAGQ